MKKRLPWLIFALLALAIVVLRLGFFHSVRIEGSSMQDSLMSGDVALVWRLDGAPERFDIVECRFPGRSGTYIKRVVGLPGEHVELSGYSLRIDGETIPEPHVTSPAEDFSVTLGEDEFLVLGDNRTESYDSREADMGPLGREDILGRVCFVLWPPHGIK